MKKITLLTTTLVLTAFTAFSQSKDYKISSWQIEISHLTADAKKAIEATKDKEKLNVKLNSEATQQDLEAVCKLKWITKFSIEVNEVITNIAPLANLSNLTQLDLKMMRASNTNPFDLSALEKLTNITDLSFYGTKVTNTQKLAKLTQLKKLSFYMSAVSNIDVVKNFTELEDLNLYGAEHTFTSYEAVAQLPKLKVLNVYMNKTATDALLAPLIKLTTLEHFDMANNDETTHLNFLVNCKNMKSISASWSGLTDISALKNFSNLKKLDLYDCKATDYSAIANLSNLEDLKISGSKATNFNFLENLTALKYLTISNTEINSSAVFKNMSNLKELEIKETKLTELSGIQNLPNLETIEATKSPIANLNDIKTLKKLYKLYIDGTAINDLSVLADCTELKYLIISNTIKQENIDALKAKLPDIDIEIVENN